MNYGQKCARTAADYTISFVPFSCPHFSSICSHFHFLSDLEIRPPASQQAHAHHHTSTLSFIMNNSTHTNMCTRSQYALIHYLSHSEIPQTHTHKKKSPTPKYWEFSKSPKNQGNMKVKQKDSTPQNNGYELVVNYWEGTVV